MGPVKTQQLGRTGLEVSSIVLGLMRIDSLDDAAIDALVRTALDEGVTVLDHADVYGGDHLCERRFAEAVKLTPSERERVLIQSKCGIRDGFFDFSTEHIVSSVDASLRALQTDHLDLLLLHRPDALVEPEEVAAAFDQLEAAGKVRRFGVSNHTPYQQELLKTAVRQPLEVNQVQLSITHSSLISTGVASNMEGLEQSVHRDGGMLEHARIHGTTLQAWSPFQGGFFTGVFLGDREKYADLNDVLDELADAHGVTPTGIATAWITRHPADIQVVLGTTKPERVREAVAGSDVRLSRQEWYRLFTAAGSLVP
ncbi:aldo/keto reductase family oxidoreductase [Quadrisphaera setariae]|uniref:Aldo/keto reductase family oxidoreductase n=1 Tax=Quadrisphaera setariae TaxID=2593304 RepID=A0A5C8Z6P0_9ACTN|nr:aldo/keto reductase family oxidoreductase [Quadrisphaera setariae]